MIEREAFSGNVLGLIATNALELGVDIGVLDAVIMLGFPLSIASFVGGINVTHRYHTYVKIATTSWTSGQKGP